ncbi:MAG: 7-cyano-7-deazaguanine synthase QueC [bacterium]|nr:7-cyano-7-deazaguanine synthase QueC [bacterium]
MSKAIVLMSGGLDSLVALADAKNNYDVELALTFDYGQKSLAQEVSAAKKICEFYNVEHKLIKLDWLKEITKTSLVSDKEVPSVDEKDLDSEEKAIDSCMQVWVPNRNSVFLNIAAAYADSFGYEYIIMGANEEEAATFSDNSQNFIDKINENFKFSTNVKPQVLAPLINLNKGGIVKKAIELQAPIRLIRSCYSAGDKHCGKCESCVRLKRALIQNGCENIIAQLF